jgi:hypothetical protein
MSIQISISIVASFIYISLSNVLEYENPLDDFVLEQLVSYQLYKTTILCLLRSIGECKGPLNAGLHFLTYKCSAKQEGNRGWNRGQTQPGIGCPGEND